MAFRKYEGRPIFFVHEASGGVSYARALAGSMAAGVPVYGLGPSDDLGLRTLQARARRLARAARSVQPVGPYRIAGRSSGATLAYEVATHLLGEDEEVEFLGLIDPCDPAGDGESPPQPIPIPVHFFWTIDEPEAAARRRRWSLVVSRAQTWDGAAPARDAATKAHWPIEALGGPLSDALAAAAAHAAPSTRGSSPLFTIQSGRGKAPVFCVPGAGASVTAFTDLAGTLGPEWTVHGLQPRGLDGGVPHSSVHAAARFYLRALSEACPRGPLHLIGHSFGGWVTFEMALRLRAAGRAPASLTLVDTGPPPDGDDAREGDYDHLEVLSKLVRIFELGAERSLELGPRDLAPLGDAARLECIHRRLVSIGTMPRRSGPEALRGIVRTFAAHIRSGYAPAATYDGEMGLVLVDASDEDTVLRRRRHDESAAGWRRLAPRVVTWRAPGNHVTVLRRPHVDALAGAWLRGFAASCAPAGRLAAPLST